MVEASRGAPAISSQRTLQPPEALVPDQRCNHPQYKGAGKCGEIAERVGPEDKRSTRAWRRAYEYARAA
jgi:hypothetical protein